MRICSALDALFLARLAVALALVAMPARAELTHRYSFTTDAADSVGTAHGTLAGTAAVTGGTVVLDASPGAFVNLPGGLLEGYAGVTFEAWARFSSSGNWTRLFDFGASSGDNGRNYIFFSPHSGAADHRLVISDADPGFGHENMVAASGVLDDDSYVHVVATLNPATGWGAIYVNGALVADSEDITIPLAAVAPDLCYLGRSLYVPDPLMAGAIDEFRLHNTALSSPEVAASYAAGADTVDYDPGAVQSLALTLPPQVRVNGVLLPELTGVFERVGEIILGVADVTLSSSATSIVEVRTNGTLLAKAVGTTTIKAERGGKTASAILNVLPAPVILINRYSFNEDAGATEVSDSVSGANGTLFAAAQGGNTVRLGGGQAVFPGGASYANGAYIDLPDRLLSNRTNVTIEVWATWNGPSGSVWQRIFDFGNGGKGEDPARSGNGTGSFFLTPRGGGNVVRFDAAPTGFANERILDGADILPVGTESHIVCIYAPANRVSQLWVNGRLMVSSTAPFVLGALQDVNNWLGVSNWNDPPFSGAINEFRIYEGQLTEIEIALRRQAGPNALPADPGLLQSISLNPPSLLIGNPNATPAGLQADFQKIKKVDITALPSAKYSSTDTSVFTVATGGALRPIKLGMAQLVATYQGLSATSTVAVVAPTAVHLVAPTPLPAGGPLTNAVLRVDFPGGLSADVAGFTGVVFVSSDTNIATLGTRGGLYPLRVGATRLSATYFGLGAEASVEVALPAGYERARPLHRYSFSGASGTTVVTDSVGAANGELINPSANWGFTGAGRLRLQGGAWNATTQPGYVNLPNGLVSHLRSVTIEGWVRWTGPSSTSWQRIFDFGRNAALDANGDPAEDAYLNPGIGYMFLTPRSGSNTLRFAIKEDDGLEAPVVEATTFPVNQDAHFAVVYDTAAGAVRLYVNGRRVQTAAISYALSVVEDLNVYLGRSQWTDPYFAGDFDEFRIYEGTLLDDEVAATFAAGPDRLPNLAPKPVLTWAVDAGGLVLTWPAEASGFLLESSEGIPASTWTAVAGVVNQKASVPFTARARFFRLHQP